MRSYPLAATWAFCMALGIFASMFWIFREPTHRAVDGALSCGICLFFGWHQGRKAAKEPTNALR